MMANQKHPYWTKWRSWSLLSTDSVPKEGKAEDEEAHSDSTYARLCATIVESVGISNAIAQSHRWDRGIHEDEEDHSCEECSPEEDRCVLRLAETEQRRKTYSDGATSSGPEIRSRETIKEDET